MRPSRSTRLVALGLTVAAVTPVTTAAGQDLRSPDARDAVTARATNDLRSPDASDAAAGRSAAEAPSVVVVRLPQDQTARGGLRWGDAGIGAGGVLAVVALAGGSVALERRRHVDATRAV